MRIKYIFIIGIFLLGNISKAQPKYFDEVLKVLTSKKMSGRGYTHDGMKNASFYLSNEFKKIGLKSFETDYLQPHQFPINIIEDASLKINGKKLIYGKDYIVKPSSKSIDNQKKKSFYTFSVEEYIKSFDNRESTKDFVLNDHKQQLDKNIILPPLDTDVDSIQKYYKQWANIYEVDSDENRAIFRFTKDSLLSSLSQRQANVTEFIIKEKYYTNNLKINNFSLKSTFKKDFEFNNVIGYIEGENNDSVIVISAHYDHLGQVGNSIFPGASDNASGTAMVLELAKYYTENKPKYKTVFMLFGAEEAGIVGSFKYVNEPIFPLQKIKFLVNLDIMGGGDEGIQVVNGTKFKKEFSKLEKLNADNNLLKHVKVRGESCNSDHCPFYQKNVPSFFIYTLGGKGNYHNIYDTYQNLDLSHVAPIKELLIKFVNQL
ncbi:M28 family metallopeptidase [Faecalibacter rhinopitheci]|uniref:Zn-dependent exopeptidase M28 n=1 Tax=Faecalibacter rhinopitheci TaxID=2779678 RepID=A0A8J7FVP4_9FLAO|nr:M28 family peptidase [Faecalibacter rhinopitheci]MBF0596343.1 Zn-dependent exopeptidase M28 [Faecalibacter rhinopitheci]